LLLPNQNRGFDGLISFVYCFGCEPENPSSYLFDCAILAPTNEVVAVINKKMIQQLAYEEMSYYSSDSIHDSSANYSTIEALYPTNTTKKLFFNGFGLTSVSLWPMEVS
jgi:ATP-dependent DNA helicase PIF1